jgi:hypothetical protein
VSGAGRDRSTVVRGSAALLVAGTLLLLTGCHAGSAARPDNAATAPSAVTVTAGPAAAARSSADRPDTAQLDEVDAILNRIEQELDSDGGR